MAISARLFELERLDMDLVSLQRHLAEQRRLQQESPEVRAAEERLERLRGTMQGLLAKQRTLEAELEDIEARIARDRGRMYNGQVVDPREIASLERELVHYEERRDPLENRLLALMDEIEALEPGLAEAERQASETRARWESGKPDGARRAAETAGVLEELRTDRDELAAQIDPRTLDQYTRLHRSLGNAVSVVKSGVCQWCRVGIPAKDIQHVRAGHLVTCPNCARILHVVS